MNEIPRASHITTNDVVFQLIDRASGFSGRLLDIGAGAGHMAQRISEHIKRQGSDPGSILSACDMFPEKFEYQDLICDKLNFTTRFPYEDNAFDIAYAVEVVEHLYHPYHFITEALRIIKPGGRLIFSTPNIPNINSRLTYFFKGFYKLFDPLSTAPEAARHTIGHVMPLSFYYWHFFLKRAGFEEIRLHVDRIKRSASLYFFLFYPLMKLGERSLVRRAQRESESLLQENRITLSHINSFQLLCSRSIILEATKPG